MRKSVKRYLCRDCKKILQDSGLVYKRVPSTEGSEERCAWCDAWCERERFGTTYKILYGRNDQ